MNTVEDIEQAIEKLSPLEFARLASWMAQREMTAWQQELDEDSASGRLDFLFEEADREAKAGVLRDWPPSK